ncbi:DISEASE RESISTANCE PROTEIN RP [Salix koriyanagi]|uniref:DISEASE RESISTANCE PROTEIN RP n=1 Tax=Salix koriyanagi TaxID=2511006 RepID=A0A9Q0VB61_9ROSI|nr:DISEASE RESISTANCE PROTEIN RP [Salix koriyanagi]
MSRNKISREVRTFFSGSNQFVYGWQTGHKVKELRERLDDIVSESEKFHFEVRYEEKASLPMIREPTNSSEPEIFFGREDEKKKVMSFLLNSNDEIESVSVISIVGMGGLGKTAFSQSIFNDEQVNLNFGLKLWVSVSGGFVVEKILKDVSDQLESLKSKLKEKIVNRKYLLVLDDVWDSEDGQDGEKWDKLKQSLPRKDRGNKMIITTRSHAIATLTSRVPLELKGLADEDSWSLFSNKAFVSESNNIDKNIKQEIVERCCGVPLVIKAIARLMSSKNRAQWLSFVKQELPNRSIKVERGGNRICEWTRHVSFDKEFDLSLPCAERLRTLVLLQGGEMDGGALESICRDFRRLRVLVLSHFRIKEVSPLIEKLKHLKYLDLSNNEMEALPNSVTNLVNLQVLKLNGCRNLKELPRGINKLINLRHLDGDFCGSLEYMPRGIGKLTGLQTLSCFVVAKNRSPKSKMVGGLDELSRLNKLRGSLEIRVKGCEMDGCISEFEGAKLEDKQYLQSLTIKWRDIDMDSDIDLYDRMLRSLQPNSSLQELGVEDYGGMRFPSWLSSLSNLVRIRLNGCRRLEHIPPLDGIPYLEELFIHSMGNLEYIDSEGVGGKEVRLVDSKFFPSLKKLVIFECPRLKGWWKKSRGEMKDDSDESTVEEEFFPRLSSLTIDLCPNLTSMPLFPTLDEYLQLINTSSMPLQQTMKMKPPVSSSSSSSSFIRPLSNLKKLYISYIDVESLPEVGLQNLSSLQQLEIFGCPRLKSLPLHGQGMPSLQLLIIDECPRLKSLSESKSQGMIPYLPSLQELTINDCSEELSTGWGKESEEVWPNIKHIPNILIDYYYIQKEGRYVEGEGLEWKSI